MEGGRGGTPTWVTSLVSCLLCLAGLAGDLWWIKRRWESPGADVSGLQVIVAVLLAGMAWLTAAQFVKRLVFEASEFEVKPLRVQPGGEVRVTYRQQARRAVRIPKASVRLIFNEHARSGSGKSSTTYEHETVVQSVDRTELMLEAGQDLLLTARFQVPATAMHSFDSGQNRLEWKVAAAVQVQGWPDMADEEDLEVAPPGRPTGEPEE